MRHNKYFILLTVLAAFVTINANAQRTSDGSWAATVSYSFIGQGLDLGAQHYTSLGYADFGGMAHYWGEYGTGASSLENSNVGAWNVYAGYMFRAVGTRDRAFSLYGGGGCIVGWEKIQRWFGTDSELDSDGDGVEDASALSYGVVFRAEAELYLSNSFAFVLDAGVPVNANSAKTSVRYTAGLGIRYSF